jgi:eukaryotic-like serine/threonine-protein kinase
LGRQLDSQATVAAWRQAIDAYRTAISLDPRYAEAYAELALSEYHLSDHIANSALGKSAEQAAQKAIDLDPQLAYGYSVRGLLRAYLHFDWAGAELDDRRALALEPFNSRVLMRYANNLLCVGRLDEAVATFRKAVELSPLDNAPWDALGVALTASGHYPDAYDAFRHALAIRSTPGTSWSLALLQLLDGKALDALVTSQAIDFDAYQYAGVAMAEHTLGDAKASQQALDHLIATSTGGAAYQVAEVYAWRSEKDMAVEWLERAYRQQDGGLSDAKIDPRLASLRGDPRYTALLRKLNFPL